MTTKKTKIDENKKDAESKEEATVKKRASRVSKKDNENNLDTNKEQKQENTTALSTPDASEKKLTKGVRSASSEKKTKNTIAKESDVVKSKTRTQKKVGINSKEVVKTPRVLSKTEIALDEALRRASELRSTLMKLKMKQYKGENLTEGDENVASMSIELVDELSDELIEKLKDDLNLDLTNLTEDFVEELRDNLPHDLHESLQSVFEQVLQEENQTEGRNTKPQDSMSEEEMWAQIPEVLPALPLRDTVIFNSMVLPLYETREKGILAIEQAFLNSKFIFLSTQKELAHEAPLAEDIYEVGTIALILRTLKMPKGHLKILVQGIARAKIKKVIQEEPFLEVEVELIREDKHTELSLEVEALVRTAREQSEKILQLRGLPVSDIMGVLMQVTEPGRIADLIASNMRLNIPEAQRLLECVDGIERLSLVNEHLVHEIEIADIQARIQNHAREGMDKAQKAYFLREQMKAIRSELGDSANADEELDNIREAIEKLSLPKDAKKEAIKQCNRLASMGQDSAEANVIRTYLDWIVELPWKKMSRDSLDIKKAKAMLDEDHFGLDKIKDRILEFLSVRKLNPAAKGSILCFVGPPGVGKTSLGASIARVMNRKFYRVSLGGMRDEAEIRGHRRTYIGAMPGRIIQALKQAGTRNPVILLDEIDKLGNDFRGDPSSALLEALDPEQNAHFSDHYLNVPFDLSKVLFICTANSLEEIPSALRDRLEVIKLSGYTEFEKVSIAQKYLIKRQAQDNGLEKNASGKNSLDKKDSKTVKFSSSAIQLLIREYTREAGLRNLEREIGKVCRKMARNVAEGKKISYTINDKLVHTYLGVPRFIEEDRDKELIPGVATGLAWTASGGDVLYVEVSLMKGKGVLNLTGQLGDVMKESAQAALSYARAHVDTLHLEPDFHENYDFHIHVPAGATPKDGPSAGVTLVTALVSALSKKPVKNNLCMTGEISLRGRVMPVGGIKEKILAAVSKGLTDVIIPEQNKKDLEEIPTDLLEQIKIHPVNSLSQVLELALDIKE